MEKRLIDAARGGHARATATILHRMQNRWFRFALARTGSPRRAVEVVQDSALGVMAGRADMPDPKKFEAWSMALAARSAAQPDGPADPVKEARASGLPIPIAHLDDDDKAVLAKLRTLAPDGLACLLLRIGERLPRTDVADITGKSPAEVTTLVKSAIGSLRAIPVADWPVDPQAWYLRGVYPSDLREELFQKRKPKWIVRVAAALFFVSVVMIAIGNHRKPNRDVMPATTATATAP